MDSRTTIYGAASGRCRCRGMGPELGLGLLLYVCMYVCSTFTHR